ASFARPLRQNRNLLGTIPLTIAADDVIAHHDTLRPSLMRRAHSIRAGYGCGSGPSPGAGSSPSFRGTAASFTDSAGWLAGPRGPIRTNSLATTSGTPVGVYSRRAARTPTYCPRIAPIF